MSKGLKILNLKGKVVLIVCIAILALVLVGVLFYNFKLNNNTNQQQEQNNQIVNNGEINNKVKDHEEKELGYRDSSGDKQEKEELNLNGLKVKEFKLINQEGSILIKGEIENPTEKEFENTELLFELYNSSGNKMLDYTMVISEKIEPKEIRKVETVIGLDNDEITDISVQIIDSQNL